MKYLKQFNFISEYDSFVNSEDYVTPNVSFIVENEDVRYEKQRDFIIMTYESNPAVMNICYYQGWAASPDVMYKSEAEKVTDIGTAFKGLQGNTNTYDYGTYGTYGSDNLTEAFTSFDEFKYFTGVTSIDSYAFTGCTNLTSITIPDSVTSIGDWAFEGCWGLTSIEIPNSVTTIGDGAFVNCPGLTSINIPDSVTSIGDWAFADCSGLTSITCLAPTAPSIHDNTFNGVKNSGILKVPTGSDYSSWMSHGPYYLGYYNWTIEYI